MKSNVVAMSGLYDLLRPDVVVTLICADRRPFVQWQKIAASGERIVMVSSPEGVPLALSEAHRRGCEVKRIIFDRTIGAGGFLHFLSTLSHHFRGDAMLISDEGIFISVLMKDSRGIHMLEPEDLEFYVGVTFTTYADGLPC
jgi:hypothetical protein